MILKQKGFVWPQRKHVVSPRSRVLFEVYVRNELLVAFIFVHFTGGDHDVHKHQHPAVDDQRRALGPARAHLRILRHHVLRYVGGLQTLLSPSLSLRPNVDQTSLSLYLPLMPRSSWSRLTVFLHEKELLTFSFTRYSSRCKSSQGACVCLACACELGMFECPCAHVVHTYLLYQGPEWDMLNVLVTGHSDGVARVSLACLVWHER